MTANPVTVATESNRRPCFELTVGVIGLLIQVADEFRVPVGVRDAVPAGKAAVAAGALPRRLAGVCKRPPVCGAGSRTSGSDDLAQRRDIVQRLTPARS